MKARKRRRKLRTRSGFCPTAAWLLSLTFASLLLIPILNSICLDLRDVAPSSPFPQEASAAAQTLAASNSTLHANAKPFESRRTTSVKLQPEGKKRTRVKVAQDNRNQTSKKGNFWQPTESRLLRQHQQQEPSEARREHLSRSHEEALQVSITPRVSLVRVPVESNAILKCLISAQTNNFTRPFQIKWSRKIDSMYEQIESSSALDDNDDDHNYPRAASKGTGQAPSAKSKRENEPAAIHLGQLENSSDPQLDDVPNRLEELRNFLARSRQETNVISNILIEATLSINSVKASDNASYYCTATESNSSWPEHNKARIDLLALSRPIVRLERVQPARDSKSALVHWSIVSDGNALIKKTILTVRNDSRHSSGSSRFQPVNLATSLSQQLEQQHASVVLDSEGQQWHRIDIQGDGSDLNQAQEHLQHQQHPQGEPNNYRQSQMGEPDVDVTSIGGNGGGSSLGLSSWPAADSESSRVNSQRRAFNLSSLLPGVTYQLRLAAINDMGQSDWSQLAATMPNEIPAQISDIQVLSATNDSITIGWRRSPHDIAKTIRYEMQLFDLNRTLTLDANTNTNSSGQMRTNFMFHFVNLNPGTDYHFHIRACSRAGCSAHSSPKLLASTLDGESDEPLDVELVCNMGGGGGGGASTSNLSVSWLPPVNVRGRLLNYSATIESIARYQNQSGQWTSDEWRTTMDTSDNHTLGLEAGNLLTPNTNYSARVCANNRSKKCGKPSQLTARSRCSTPADLPRELPAHIGLALKQAKATEPHQATPETLVLETPFISLRNGSIDCLQVVLVRLPKSFGDSQRALSDFLPDDPAQIKTHEWLELYNETTSEEPTQALAYLADELDQVAQRGSPEEVASGIKQIVLGDGIQSSCASLRVTLARNSTESNKPIQALDGPLIAQTYYTGFLKLIQIKNNNQLKQEPLTMADEAGLKKDPSGVELLAKYSNYFSPLKTGDNVPQVSIDSLVASSSTSNFYQENDEQQQQQQHQHQQVNNRSQGGVCAHKLVQQVQEKLGVSQAPCLMVAKFAESARKSLVRFYRSASSSLSQFLDREQRQASPMQPLEIGLFVFVASLLLLFIIYLFTLPSRLKRKSRLKMNRQLAQYEQAAAAQQAGENSHQQQQQQFVNGQLSAPGKQQADLHALTASLGYQQVMAPNHMQVHQSPSGQARQHVSAAGPGAGATLQRAPPPQECPVHSSPMSAQVGVSEDNGAHYGLNTQVGAHSGVEANDDEEEARDHQLMSIHRDRRQSVHVCQQANPAHQHHHAHHHNSHRHDHSQQQHHQNQQQQQQQHVHHKSAYQLDQLSGGCEFNGHAHQPAHTMNYERNCRTMTRHRRPTNGAFEPGDDAGQQMAPVHYNHQQQQQQHHQQQATAHSYDNNQMRYQTMTMQHQSVLALAKKINKPVPLGLFRSVYESRLKSGWLREEYEQLPRSPQQLAQLNLTPPPPPPPPDRDGRQIKLRPQLIVSRDDSISALISGNDHYDGSLVKLPVQVGGCVEHGESAPVSSIEKQFICAKSPVDPDSVWDFWRLIYEREVSTLVMLTAHVDVHTGDIKCAQYWPTCDNEETTILSPCNEFVQQSAILPAKFKVRQETLNLALDIDGSSEFVVRRLTLLVMATKSSENEHTNQADATSNEHKTTTTTTSRRLAANDHHQASGATRVVQQTAQDEDLPQAPPPPLSVNAGESESEQGQEGREGRERREGREEDEEEDEEGEDEERMIIVERNLLHFQFLHWNANNPGNQAKLLRFIELVNARHARSIQLQASPGADWHHISPQSPILIHCANGLGRSGLFAAMSFVIDDQIHKLAARARLPMHKYQMNAKLNLFQLVARMRAQRDMLLSPYRFYELLYQLTTQCIEAQLLLSQEQKLKDNEMHHRHIQHHHHHHNNNGAACANNNHNGGLLR